jgi:hypothetical protein
MLDTDRNDLVSSLTPICLMFRFPGGMWPIKTLIETSSFTPDALRDQTLYCSLECVWLLVYPATTGACEGGSEGELYVWPHDETFCGTSVCDQHTIR